MKGSPTLSALLQSFFADRLLGQRNASPHTIASYRDTSRLLLTFAQRHLHLPPSKLAVENLDAPFERLKLTGCWWKSPNAEAMLGLRVARANGLWDSYWKRPVPQLN